MFAHSLVKFIRESKKEKEKFLQNEKKYWNADEVYFTLIWFLDSDLDSYSDSVLSLISTPCCLNQQMKEAKCKVQRIKSLIVAQQQLKYEWNIYK